MNKKIFTIAIISIIAITFFASCSARRSARTADEGVVINGIRWATRNVDAPGTFARNPEDFGMLYQWNRRQGWAATGNDWNSSVPIGETWERRSDPCPRGWRVPTREELESLARVRIGQTTRNGVSGHLFGTTDNQIFLPTAGGRNVEGVLNNAGIIGFYWSSTQYNERRAWRLQFDRTRTWVHRDSSRPSGLSVRCVAIK